MASDRNVELSHSKKSRDGRYASVSINYSKGNKAGNIDENEADNDDDNQQLIFSKRPPKTCCMGCKDECHEIITSKKWWPNWFALTLALGAVLISIEINIGAEDVEDDVEGVTTKRILDFNRWFNDPSVSVNKTNAIGMSGLYFTIFFIIILMEVVTNRADPAKKKDCSDLLIQIKDHYIAYTIFYFIVLFCFFFDAQDDLNRTGIGYSIIAIIIGLLMTNIFLYFDNKIWDNLTKQATKNCSFYIKCGLVLLATDLEAIIARGAPGLIVAWLIPPLIIVFMWWYGVRIVKIQNLEFVITMACGTAICGTSAIAAVAPVVNLSDEDTAIAMGILSFFTIAYMLIVPYICILADINNTVCGAWIGGSVDETGKVVASVSIVNNDDATDTAVLIKISQNMLIGFVCLGLAVMWNDMLKYEKKRKKRLLAKKNNLDYNSMTSKSNENAAEDDEEDDMNKCYFLWKKFPKFIIGYLGLSVVITVLINPLTNDDYSDRFQTNISALSKWMFTIGFVGIGAKVKFTALWESIKDGKYLKLYLVGQTIDTIITFVVAMVVFTYISPDT